MKTSLQFEAPGDLSVGRVTISNAKRQVADWVATPDDLRFEIDSLAPGFYSAEITPAGVTPQSLVFEVRRGEANTVIAPLFSALMVSGGSATFIDVSDHQAAIKALYGKPRVIHINSEPSAESSQFSDSAAGMEKSSEVTDRRISIGLSQEVSGERDSWQAFEGVASYELTGGKLNIGVEAKPGWSPASAERVRLSLAIEGVRVERLLLPMYSGGTHITVTPSVLSSNDIEVQVLPAEPRLRALLRALVAGTPEEATAVRVNVLDNGSLSALLDKSADDPWGAILAGLLFIRFPDVFGNLTPPMIEALVASAPWAYDSYVIQARQQLYGADPNEQKTAARDALGLLARAQTWKAPYFAYSNQLFSELIETLYVFADASEPELHAQAEKIRSRWLRDGPLQSSAGASFSWFRRDQELLKKGVLAPDRSSKGQLSSRHSTNLFSGRITDGQLSFGATESAGPKEIVPGGEGSESLINSAGAPPDCPAARRRPGPHDDPNKGRFGKTDLSGGFTLSSTFQEVGDGKWVSITMTVTADRDTQIRPGDSAWFCLHPTFRPQWVKVMFRGSSASLVQQAWGGFTVGVWLPEHKVELESDLAKQPDAPRAIVEL